MKYYLFAKFLTSMSEKDLMKQCKELGFDGPTLTIRDGFWTPPDDLSKVKPFIKAAEDEGLEVKYAQIPYLPDAPEADECFAVLAENGIEQVRLDWMKRPRGVGFDARTLPDAAKKLAEAAENLGRRHGIRAVMQIHCNKYPHNATSMYEAVKDFDPRYLGVKLDPGNNVMSEGYEHLDYQVSLLRDYISVLGAKSAGIFRDPTREYANGWYREVVPSQEGMIDYKELYSYLKEIDFAGPTVLMPFYDADDPEKLLKDLRDELAYFKKCHENA